MLKACSSFFRLVSDTHSITVATLVTCVRIFCVPFVVLSIGDQQWGRALLIFGMAAFTDILDGALARWRNERTLFGACLDPLADKLLLLSSFAALSLFEGPYEIIPAWFFWLLVIKELVLIGSIFFVYMQYGKVSLCPTLLGKMTTFVQIFLVISLITSYFLNNRLGYVYQGLLLIATCMTVGSYVQYVRIWYRQQNQLQR